MIMVEVDSNNVAKILGEETTEITETTVASVTTEWVDKETTEWVVVQEIIEMDRVDQEITEMDQATEMVTTEILKRDSNC
jgi:hypothetical protein